MKSARIVIILVSLVGLGAGCSGGGGEGDEVGGPIDAALATQGEQAFTAKGCNACHTIGEGRLVGPDLSEVTERRDYAFVVGIIVNPDSMLANDDTARALLARYLTPMANQAVTLEEARALFEYFRSNDSEAAGDSGDGA